MNEEKEIPPEEVRIINLESKIHTIEAAKDLCKHAHAGVSVLIRIPNSEINYVLHDNESLLSMLNAEKRTLTKEIEAMKHLIENPR